MSLMIFEWREDAEFGDYGWIAKGYPNFNITRPEVFSHDCIEHLPRGLERHGPYADELLALGARLMIRVETGWFYERLYIGSAADAWAAELQMVYEDMYSSMARTLPDPGFVAPIDDCMEPEITAAVCKFRKNMRSEIETGALGLPMPNAKLCGQMASWLRLGYHACGERFKGRSPFDIMELARNMDREAKRYQYGEEGDLLHVRVHEKDMEFSFRQVTPNSAW